jgi:nucleotide-binding universal stress UspA family protein
MRLDRIAIGIDFSESSLDAARWATRHFAPGAEVVLIHCLEIVPTPSFLGDILPRGDEMEKSAREGAEHRLREVARSLGTERNWIEVRSGRPPDQIAAVAMERGVDIIVVGEHGHHRGFWGVLGSTAEQLVRTSPVPVLVARYLPAGPPRTILLPTGESELMSEAHRWGRFLAERFGARAIALYAASPALVGRMRAVSSTTKEHELEEQILRQGREWLEGLLEKEGFEPGEVRAQVVIGSAGAEIVAAAERYGVDLIVMASRGAGRVGQALVGSVARFTLRGAECPVLVVNQPKK